MKAQASYATICPECQEMIHFHKMPELDHLLLCPHCETILWVTSVKPLRLDWGFEEPISEDELTYLRSDQRTYWQFRPRHP